MPDPDATIAMAGLARQLADALIAFARERRTEDKQAIALLHTELCAARRRELDADSPPHEPPPT